MLLKELTERSPMRVFENSIHGGLGSGNLGVVVARHGMGKTAFLVDIALDDLLRGRKVLHVTIGRTIEHVREYYVEIFHDLAQSTALESAAEIRREIESHRHIKAYLKDTFSVEHLKAHIAMLREAMGFVPVAIVIDGYDFEAATTDFDPGAPHDRGEPEVRDLDVGPHAPHRPARRERHPRAGGAPDERAGGHRPHGPRRQGREPARS